MNNPLFAGINAVSISVPDLDHARAFYRDVLALGPPLYDLPDAGWIEFIRRTLRKPRAHEGRARRSRTPAPPSSSTSRTATQPASCDTAA